MPKKNVPGLKKWVKFAASEQLKINFTLIIFLKS